MKGFFWKMNGTCCNTCVNSFGYCSTWCFVGPSWSKGLGTCFNFTRAGRQRVQDSAACVFLGGGSSFYKRMRNLGIVTRFHNRPQGSWKEHWGDLFAAVYVGNFHFQLSHHFFALTTYLLLSDGWQTGLQSKFAMQSWRILFLNGLCTRKVPYSNADVLGIRNSGRQCVAVIGSSYLKNLSLVDIILCDFNINYFNDNEVKKLGLKELIKI